jgi:hypothetical protein
LTFWGGLSLKTQDGRKGLIEDHKVAARRHGVTVIYSTALTKLNQDSNTGSVSSVVVHHGGRGYVIKVKAVILAAGGFEANPRMRSQYLGPGWDTAFVRGTPYNTRDVLELAIRDVNAKQSGNWSGCHSVAWDANAPPDTGNREVSNEFTKSGYPMGLMSNSEGERLFMRVLTCETTHMRSWDAQFSLGLAILHFKFGIPERSRGFGRKNTAKREWGELQRLTSRS